MVACWSLCSLGVNSHMRCRSSKFNGIFSGFTNTTSNENVSEKGIGTLEYINSRITMREHLSFKGMHKISWNERFYKQWITVSVNLIFFKVSQIRTVIDLVFRTFSDDSFMKLFYALTINKEIPKACYDESAWMIGRHEYTVIKGINLKTNDIISLEPCDVNGLSALIEAKLGRVNEVNQIRAGWLL